MSGKTYTLAELVHAVRPDASRDQAALLTRRIRYWTKEGCLDPWFQATGGKGHHRRYSATAPYVAAIQAEMASFGASVWLLSLVGMWFGQILNAIGGAHIRGKALNRHLHLQRGLWADAIAGQGCVLLFIRPHEAVGSEAPGAELALVNAADDDQRLKRRRSRRRASDRRLPQHLETPRSVPV